MLYNAGMQPKYYGAAADYRKPGGMGFHFDRKLLMILGGGVVAITLIAIAFGLLNAASSAPKNDLTTLFARERSLMSFVSKNRASISGSDLKKVAAEAELLLASDSALLSAQLAALYGITEIPQSIVDLEADTTSATKLANAQASGTFDQTFAGLLRDKIAATYALTVKINNTAPDELKATLAHSTKALEAIDTQLTALN